MSLQRRQIKKIQRRIYRVRKKLQTSSDKPRVSVFRSLKHMYAQVIDDVNQKTLASCSSLELKNLKGNKRSVARAIGIELASRAKAQGINTVVFDRGPFLYHGRVEALADGLREGGIKI